MRPTPPIATNQPPGPEASPEGDKETIPADAAGNEPTDAAGVVPRVARDAAGGPSLRIDIDSLLPVRGELHRASNGNQKQIEVRAGIPRRRRARNQPTRIAIIERYRRREGSAEEALLELFHAGISIRQVEDILEALWGGRVSVATLSELNRKVVRRIEAWCHRPLEGTHPYVYLGAIQLTRNWGGEKIDATVLTATAVNAAGVRTGLGVAGGQGVSRETWSGFLRDLDRRGLSGVRLVVSDQDLAEAVAEVWPQATYQGCVWNFFRTVLAEVPLALLNPAEQMLRAIHASKNERSARLAAEAVMAELRKMALPAAAAAVERDYRPTLSFYAFPREHWRILRTNLPLQKLLREVRERTRIVGAFTDPDSAALLVGARLRWQMGVIGNTRRNAAVRGTL